MIWKCTSCPFPSSFHKEPPVAETQDQCPTAWKGIPDNPTIEVKTISNSLVDTEDSLFVSNGRLGVPPAQIPPDSTQDSVTLRMVLGSPLPNLTELLSGTISPQGVLKVSTKFYNFCLVFAPTAFQYPLHQED